MSNLHNEYRREDYHFQRQAKRLFSGEPLIDDRLPPLKPLWPVVIWMTVIAAFLVTAAVWELP
jgi:hypothetical protein